MNLGQFLIVGIVFLIGLFFFIAPTVIKIENNRKLSADKRKYKKLQELKELSDEEDEASNYSELFDILEKYNKEIYINEQKELTSNLPNKDEGFDVKNLECEVPDETLFGYITLNRTRETAIKKKEIEKTKLFPINYQPTRTNLNNGFVPIRYTSMPIGGNNTCSVLYGYPKSEFGKDNKFNIKIGDTVTIETYWDILEYSVTEIFMVEKDDVDSLKIEADKDEIELLFAKPDYNLRYVVLCERIIDEG